MQGIKVNADFHVTGQSMEIVWSPITGEQLVAFNFFLTIPLVQLRRHLLTLDACTSGGGDEWQPEPLSAMPPQPPLGTPGPPGGDQVNSQLQGSPPPAPLHAAQAASESVLSIAATAVPAGGERSGDAPVAPSSNAKLLEALHKRDLEEVRTLVRQGADVNAPEPEPAGRAPLHVAIEQGVDPEAIYALLQAGADVNAVTAAGRTPCHYAIDRSRTSPPVVLQMLLCAGADLVTKDNTGTTPLDSAKNLAIDCLQPIVGSEERQCHYWVRQVLAEVTSRPTTTVSVHSTPIRDVAFGDFENDKVVFHTESGVCLHSIKERNTLVRKLNRNNFGTGQSCCVKHVSMNPYSGAVAALCQETVGTTLASMVLVWLRGNLLDEPMKLSISTEMGAIGLDDSCPPCVLMSRSPGAQRVFCRFASGDVYCWVFSTSPPGVLSEVKLVSQAGLLAASDDGKWLAVESRTQDSPGPRIMIWTIAGAANAQTNNLRIVFNVDKRPTALAVMQEEVSHGPPRCIVALAERAEEQAPASPIEVHSVDCLGQSQFLYRIGNEAVCRAVMFGHSKASFLLAAYADGLVVQYNLLEGSSIIAHDSADMQSLMLSTDMTSVVSSEANHFRVYRLPTQST